MGHLLESQASSPKSGQTTYHFYNHRNIAHNGIMATDSIVLQLKALGEPTRLRIFEFLCRCACPVGILEDGSATCELPQAASGLPVQPTVGEVCCFVLGSDRIPSTLSFHLKELRNAGLIRMEKAGRRHICSVEADAAKRLAEYFHTHVQAMESCCPGGNS